MAQNAKKKVSRKTARDYPARATDVPVTQKMLYLVRDELKSDVRSIESKMASGFKKVDARFIGNDARLASIDIRLDKVDARFREIDARFDKVDARFKEIDARFDKVDARFEEMDARFREIDIRFDKVDARFKEIDARFDRLEAKMEARFLGLESRIDRLAGDVHRIALLVEEQNAKNNIVLDGLQVLFGRQERVETEMRDLRKGMVPIK